MSCSQVQATSTASTAASTCSHGSDSSSTSQPRALSKFPKLLRRLGSNAASHYHCGEEQLEDKYELSDIVLGAGKSGDVLLAHMRCDSAEAYAVKTIEFSELHDLESWSLLECELEILGSVDHPNVMAATEIYESHDRVAVVMPCVQGGNLQQIQMTESAVLHAARQMLESLKYLHGCRIVHRDVKPENLVLDASGANLKIIDFGLAAFWKHGDRKMQLRCGTRGYMSPEMRTGKGYTNATDMWSVGVTLYELLVGEMPFDADGFPPQQGDVEALLASPACSHLHVASRHLIASLLKLDPSARPHAEEALRHPSLVKEDINTCEASIPGPTADTMSELALWESSLRRETEEPRKACWADLDDDDDDGDGQWTADEMSWESSLLGQKKQMAKEPRKHCWADLVDSDDD